MQVILRVLTGKSEGKDIKIKKAQFLIGRHEDCHLRPKTDSVSRRHCQIIVEADRVLVSDMGSKNGTFVNDQKLEEEVELKNGDLLRVGKMRFEMKIDLGAEESRSDASSRIVLDGDITDWLEEADVKASEQKIGDPDTRQFRLSDMETINAAKLAAEAEAEADDGDEPEDAEAEKRRKLARKTPPSSDNSRDAAASILKRYFNRT